MKYIILLLLTTIVANSTELIKVDYEDQELIDKYKEYQVYEFDFNEIKNEFYLNGFSRLNFELFGNNYELILEKNEILADDYISSSGINEIFTCDAYDENGNRTKITIAENSILGEIYSENQQLFFNTLQGKIFAYDENNLEKTDNGGCFFDEAKDLVEQYNQLQNSEEKTQCQEITMGIACNHLYTEHFGGPQAAETRIISLLNMVQEFYIGYFEYDFKFIIKEIYISESLQENPIEHGVIHQLALMSFDEWSLQSFNEVYDIASVWSRYDWDVLGAAYRDGICSGTRSVNMNKDVDAVIGENRTTWAHEIGHNFGAIHAPSDSSVIMNPFQGVFDRWIIYSINTINAYIDFQPHCTANCGEINLSVDENHEHLVYPNPVRDFLNIETWDYQYFEIIDQMGNIALSGDFKNGYKIPITLSSGSYLLVLKGKKTVTESIIVL